MIHRKIFNSPVIFILLILFTTLFQGGNNVIIIILLNAFLVILYNYLNISKSKDLKLLKTLFFIFLSYLIIQNIPLPNFLGHKLSLENYEIYKELYQKHK